MRNSGVAAMRENVLKMWNYSSSSASKDSSGKSGIHSCLHCSILIFALNLHPS
jgi:hypothetical protein